LCGSLNFPCIHLCVCLSLCHSCLSFLRAQQSPPSRCIQICIYNFFALSEFKSCLREPIRYFSYVVLPSHHTLEL
jgi:hypothetical protein